MSKRKDSQGNAILLKEIAYVLQDNANSFAREHSLAFLRQSNAFASECKVSKGNAVLFQENTFFFFLQANTKILKEMRYVFLRECNIFLGKHNTFARKQKFYDGIQKH